MRKHRQFIFSLSRLVFLILILPVILLNGCSQPAFPMNVHELSLTHVWYILIDLSGINERSANLSSLLAYLDDDGTVRTVHFELFGNNSKGERKYFFVDLDCRGDLSWQAYDSRDRFKSTYSPLAFFYEIDKLGLSNIFSRPNDYSLWINFHSGNAVFSFDQSDIFHLHDGQLLPLKEIDFKSSSTFGEIRVFPIITDNSGSATVVSTATAIVGKNIIIPPEDRTTQIWFLTEDLNKAEKVEYLAESEGTQ